MTRSTAPARATPDPGWTRRTRILLGGALVATALAAGTEVVRLVERDGPAGGYVALAVALVGVAVGFRRPVAGVLLVAAAPLVATVLGWDPIVTWTVAVFAAFVLTLRGLPALLAGPLVGAANFAAVGLSLGTVALTEPGASVAGFAALMAAATGSAVRNHGRYLGELHQRTHDAVATRQAAVDRGVAQERVRIARDLHDGLGHRIAVLSMHLGAAEVHLPANAEQSRSAILTARTDVQAVLTETQQILQVLRVDDDAAPSPALDGIPHLVATFRAAGLDVDATLGDLTRPVAPQVGAAGFRIVQEALTNARRHGTGGVTLRVDTTDDALVIETVNTRGRATPGPSGGGFGLVGLRERAASAGGRVEVRSDGALFTLRAVLPVTEGGAR